MSQAVDKGWSRKAPPLQGRGRGWGLSVEQLAELHDRAAQMRRNPTEPEKRLWRHLSNRQLNGFKFRRQEVIGWWIADFYCAERSLIVEVDGETHDGKGDRRRDRDLTRRGFTVLHFTNRDVMTNVDGVLTQISAGLDCTPATVTAPTPTPPLKGRGLGASKLPLQVLAR